MKDGDLIHHCYTSRCLTPDRNRDFYAGMCGAPGTSCYTVVKKDRFEEQWPNDPEFRAFADRLANAVQVVLLQGGKVGRPETSQFCPLGCLPEMRRQGRSRPASGILNLSPMRTVGFFNAFDYGSGDPANPYVRLGLAYRKRFSQ